MRGFFMNSQQKILNDNFLYYVQENNIIKAQKSLEAGADVNALDASFGRSALIYSIFNENMDMFKFLLAKGANPNKLANYKNNYVSPLMTCAMKNSYKKATETQKEMAQILIEKGADINATDHHGRTALVLSVYYCQPEMAELLIKNGADVNKVADGEPTALRIAQLNWSKYKSFEQVIKLLKEKTDQSSNLLVKPIVKQEVKISKNQMDAFNHQNDGN